MQALKKEQIKRGYQSIITPHIGHKALYITSGHYEKYREGYFQPIRTTEAQEEYLLKPMKCLHHCEIYNSAPCEIYNSAENYPYGWQSLELFIGMSYMVLSMG